MIPNRSKISENYDPGCGIVMSRPINLVVSEQVDEPVFEPTLPVTSSEEVL
jgi:hypothetical protein